MKKKMNWWGLSPTVRKTLLVMKLSLMIILAFSLQLTASVLGQQVTLNNGESLLKSILKDLHEQTGTYFMYNEDDLNASIHVNLDMKNVSLKEALDEICKQTPLEYEIIEDFVVFKKKRSVPENFIAQQEERKIKGLVTDRKGDPLPGVNILIEGQSKGTVTNSDGVYEIPVSHSNVVLVFTFIGFEKQTVVVGERTEINVQLKTEVSELDDVVVTGIFKKSKLSYTGAAVTIDGDELRDMGGRDIITKLSYIDPGLDLIENNELGSDPNNLPEINIRGNANVPNVTELKDNTKALLNTPLVLLDGFETTLVKLYDLNDHEVESITILKDASATAIYGARGANGVIVITSKSPSMGKLRVNYSIDLNIEAPDLTSFNLMNAREKLELEKRVGRWDGNEYYNTLLNNVNAGVDTDWLAQPLRTGVGQTHSLRIDGGDKTFRYSASVRYKNTTGVMKGSERNVLNGSVMFSYFYKNIRFSNNLMIDEQNESNSPFGAFSNFSEMNPYYRIHDENGNLIEKYTVRMPSYLISFGNPLYNGELNTYDKANTFGYTNNFVLEWKIKPSLVLTGKVGITKQKNESDAFKPAEHTDFMTTAYEGDKFFKKGRYDYGTGSFVSYDASVNLRYSNVIKEKHIIYAAMDYNVRQRKGYNYFFQTEGFSNEDFDFLPLALGYLGNVPPSGSESHTRSLGLVANTNYSYDNKYYVDLSLRTDGASQYGSKKRFAPFWALGMGWNMHEEAFLKDNTAINFLKLRFSTGVTGSQNFSAYQAQSTYGYIIDRRYYNWMGATMKEIGNENLKWQQKKNYNLGLETRFFGNRLSVQGDVYIETTEDLVSSINIPLANGFSSYIENVGSMRNKGFEARLSAELIKKSNFRWFVSSSIRYNKNEILEISKALMEAQKELELEGGTNPKLIYKSGHSTRAIWAVRSLGIDPSSGKEAYLDRFGNQTFKWNALDQVDCGIGEPKYKGNFTSNLTYKNLMLGMNFGFLFGGYKYNSTLINKVENVNFNQNVDTRVYSDRWKKPGDIAKFKSIDDNSATQKSSRFVQKERVLTGQNLSLTYRMDRKQLERLLNIETIEHLSLSFNTSDLFYLSNVKRERGTSYPFSRQFSFSLRTTF